MSDATWLTKKRLAQIQSILGSISLEADAKPGLFDELDSHICAQDVELTRLRDENQRLRDLLKIAHEQFCSICCPSVKKIGTDWTHVTLCLDMSAALAQSAPPSARG